MESINIRVHGLPAPKGSVTRMRNGAYLPAGTAASRMNFQNWKENISSAARMQMIGHEPWPGAIRLMAEFQLPAPKTMKKLHRGWLPHTKRPDVDKLTRALFDPLKGITWVDDSQVCFMTVNKVYAWDNQPGVFCIIDFLTDDWCEKFGSAHRVVTNTIDSL